MGKLPPQVPDLEEAVIGALMLEKKSYDVVKSFLKSEHFYVEAHKVIYEAIESLARTNRPIDMRTVVHELRSVGKLDFLPQGAYFIAELTSKVSSAANIEYHARVVVEKSMARDLIGIASRIHQDAYADETDVFKLFDRAKEDIQFLYDRETASSGPEKIKALWEKTLITDKPDELPPLVYFDQTPVCTPGNHTLLIGKKKSRKSLLVTHILHLFLKGRENLADNIAVFDTEQGKLHVWKGMDRLYRMTNQNVPFFWLRGKSPVERREFIAMTVENWAQRSTVPLKIIVIDGIRDLMSNINDPDETTEVLVWLEKLTLLYNLNIINILHINKTDNNARGHIGSELLNKAECTIEVNYDDKTTHSVVLCESSREKPFDSFMFTHGPTGLPELVGMPVGPNADNEAHITKLERAFDGQIFRHKELVDQIKTYFEVGESVAKKLIAKFIGRGWIVKSGKDRSPTTVYKLNVQPSTNGQHAIIQAPQITLFEPEPPDELPEDFFEPEPDMPF